MRVVLALGALGFAACSTTGSVTLGVGGGEDTESGQPADTGIEDIGGADDTADSADSGDVEEEDTGWRASVP